MAKRGATSDINHDNWNDPYEAEEAGSFKIASHDALEKRLIKTAKRRNKTSDSDASKSVFASFAGFKPTPPSQNATVTKPFGFLTSTPGSNSGGASIKAPTTNGITFISPAAKTDVTPQQKYLANLQQLNRSVSDWIKTHVDSNPMCILTPVFKDYEKYLKDIQEERNASEKSGTTSVSSAPTNISTFTFVSSNANDNKFKIDISTKSVSSDKADDIIVSSSVQDINNPSLSILSSSKDSGKSPLLQSNENSKSTAASIFSSFKSESTGSSLLNKPDPATLMVNPFTSTFKKEDKPGAKPFPFRNGSAPSSSSNNKEEEVDEEPDDPPKIEFTPIQEEGAVFSTRCKVFVKKDNNFKDRGVGTLFIKKVGEEKHQLLVRAETVLGNILLNVLLSSAIPTQRIGKNNVMMVCLPTPQDPPPPTSVLLRVKTGVEADDLLETLNRYK